MDLQINGVVLPWPRGLVPCKDETPIVSAEKSIAVSFRADYLACFTSNEMASVQRSSRTISIPSEYAVAVSIVGGPYDRETLDAFLSRVREQWKNFDPLGQGHADYIARLNTLITDLNSQVVPIESIKPVLVSIDCIDDHSYVVVSIREYAMTVDGEQVKFIKANAVGMVLQGTRLVRLDINREFRTPSDVEDVSNQMVAWSRAVGNAASKPMRR